MKDIFDIPGEVVIRTPVLPVDYAYNISSDLTEYFTNLWKSDEYFRNSIYTASPELYEKVVKWFGGETKSDDSENHRLITTLFKYWLRMSSRCTPYGLFAGLNLCKLGEKTSILLGAKEEHRQFRRLDMNYLCEIVQKISSLPDIRKQLRYFPNNSLYRLHDHYRFIEYSLKDKIREYQVSEFKFSTQIEIILSEAIQGKQLAELAKTITSDEISFNEAFEFVEELAINQILVNELEPQVTGDDALESLINKVKNLSGTDHLVSKLLATKSLLNQPNSGVKEFKIIGDLMQSILIGSGSKDLIQTDLVISFKESQINKKIVEGIVRQVEKILMISISGRIEVFDEFKRKFTERYETREVPLLEVLDPEYGIGFDDITNLNTDNLPLLQGLDIPGDRSNKNDLSINWSSFYEFVSLRLMQSLSSGGGPIEISDKDIEKLSRPTLGPRPGSMYIVGNIYAENSIELDQGNYCFLLTNCSGPGAGNMLGRFCHANEYLHSRVRHYIQEEEKQFPNFLFAEIVHLPQARAGNVILRPTLRSYEIPYLGNSGMPAENQILVSDLLVSVRDNEIILRSGRLGKRIIPRMSNAHNFRSSSLPVYKFLSFLQVQNILPSQVWTWGIFSSNFYLPRVIYKKVIISRAQWNFSFADHEKYFESSNYFKQFRKQNGMPQFVTMSAGDNELLLDLENNDCLGILCNELRKTMKVQLKEVLGTPNNCFVKDGNGQRYSNEIVIPLATKPHIVGEGKQAPNELSYLSQRVFNLGSEWLYVKIYAGSHSIEQILKDQITHLIEILTASKVIDKWFFIRYADPDYHLRLRFHGEGNFWSTVLNEIHNLIDPLCQRRMIFKLQTDSYVRELERYGDNTIEAIETLFCFDSVAAIKFIGLLEDDKDEKYRWLFALRATDELLNDFGFDLLKKSEILEKMRFAYSTEFGMGKSLKVKLDERFRRERDEINTILNPKMDKENEIVEVIKLLKDKSTNCAPAINSILKSFTPINGPDEYQLIGSLIHMCINRLFISNQRKQELVVYHFLSKYYDSQKAIPKFEGNLKDD